MDQLMKSYMAIMAEKDAAIRERNMAIVEKKKALADRDIAMLERDTAMSERDSVMLQRNDVIAQLQYHSSSLSGNNLSCGMSVSGIFRGGREKLEHQHHQQQHQHRHLTSQLAEAAYNPREVPFSDTFPDSEEVASESTKSKKVKRTKQPKTLKKSPKVTKGGKRLPKGSNRQPKNAGSNVTWNNELDEEWKNNLELSLVKFDDGTIPVPVCSCTGKLQSCYKWGHGGWQSACCTTTISMFPLPQTGNKRNSRIGGRKMSGSVYSKLLTRLAAEGYDFSNPVDLKEHWAKHGTNRYITIK